MAETTHESNVPAEVETSQVAETREESRYLIPAVDIYETDLALRLVADMPGVAQGDIDIRVEDGVLTIEGKTRRPPPEDALIHEFTLRSYFRQFKLGEQIDQGKIAAELKHGVLALTLPKVERAQPRRIEVKLS